MFCPECGFENDDSDLECTDCGAPLAQPTLGDATGGIIPYKNPPALIAYYLGMFSILPGIGILLGIAALILGVRGLEKYKATPEVKGVVHAWIGIGCGSLGAVVWVVSVILLIIAIVSR